MINENEAVQRLSLHEGIRLQPYRCSAGKLTIGVGRNLESNPITAEEARVLGRKDVSKGITKQEALYLLRNDIQRAEKECEEWVPSWKNLDDERQYVLLDMVFNLGIDGLLKFKKMLAYVGVGNYKQAAVEMLASNYAKQVKTRAERLAKTMETGVFRV